MPRGSEYAELVGGWIAARRAQLGLRQDQLAEAVGVSVRTITNAEAAGRAVRVMDRPKWESALGWPPGSLTEAYRRGVHPEGLATVAKLDTRRGAILREAGVPLDLGREVDVQEVLESGLPDEAQVEVLRAWHAHYKARKEFEQAFDELRSRSSAR